jgi:hypothetical protein
MTSSTTNRVTQVAVGLLTVAMVFTVADFVANEPLGRSGGLGLAHLLVSVAALTLGVVVLWQRSRAAQGPSVADGSSDDVVIDLRDGVVDAPAPTQIPATRVFDSSLV